MHKLSAVFQKFSCKTCKSKASKGRNEKIKVSIYVKSVVLASSLEIAEHFFFQNINVRQIPSTTQFKELKFIEVMKI